MWIILLLLILGYMMLYSISKKKYGDYFVECSKKIYPLKDLFPMGIWLLDTMHYSYMYKHDQVMLMKISELYGYKKARFYLKAHWANKLVLLLFAFLFIVTISVILNKIDLPFLVFGIGVIVGLFYLSDYEINKKIMKRHLSIQYEFPDFINKLTLLVNAGMTVSRAWEKVVVDHKKESALYKELEIVLIEIQSGKSEQQAYEAFARRCKIREVTKFVSVIIQHLKKGNADLIPTLRLQSIQCWQMRKNVAKRFGEEASTKMLLPMMMMFFAILVIVITPAIMAIAY